MAAAVYLYHWDWRTNLSIQSGLFFPVGKCLRLPQPGKAERGWEGSQPAVQKVFSIIERGELDACEGLGRLE